MIASFQKIALAIALSGSPNSLSETSKSLNLICKNAEYGSMVLTLDLKNEKMIISDGIVIDNIKVTENTIGALYFPNKKEIPHLIAYTINRFTGEMTEDIIMANGEINTKEYNCSVAKRKF